MEELGGSTCRHITWWVYLRGGRLKVQVSNANVALSLEVQNVKVDLKGWYLSMAPWQQAVREGTGLVRWPVMASGIPEHQ